MNQNDVLQRTIRYNWGTLPGELRWLAPGLVTGTAVYALYLLTHPYPAFGAGLYFLMADRLVEAGYSLPETIPYYTADGVPFAYPPLFFYILGALRDLTGLSALTLSRHLPGMFSIGYLVPFYVLARHLDISKPQACVATIALAICPPVLQWHISGGGVVRAGAFLFTLLGCVSGVTLFQNGRSRWMVPTAVFLGLTVLAHPLYAVFLLVSLGIFSLTFSRSVAGLLHGAGVGFGALLVSGPWIATVVGMHGWDVFTAAAGTHGGVASSLQIFLEDPGGVSMLLGDPVVLVPTALAGLYLVIRRRYLLPGWFVAIALTVGKPRFLYAFGVLFATALLFDPVLSFAEDFERSLGNTTGQAMFSIVLVLVAGFAGGTLYATSQLDTHAGSPSLPSFIDDRDRQAMTWVEEYTASDARFVVVGDAAEWFPYFSRRTILVSPWGVEWEDSAQYYRQLTLFKQYSRCDRQACLSATLASSNVHPDYIYVPRDVYTVRGMERHLAPRLDQTLRESSRYRQVYENDGVVIFRVVR